ncbi:MAG: phospholipase [Acidobacteria bacterium]|nr:MAG: phospholipase [Acidobacteriota bacterium]
MRPPPLSGTTALPDAVAAVLAALVLGGACVPPPLPRTGPAQREEEVALPGHRTVRYLLHLPSHPGAGPAPWPLILFLHGRGERGDDLSLVKREGLPRNLDGAARFPFVVVSPQCPKGRDWSVPELSAFLEAVLARHPADPERVSVLGLSSGGAAALRLAAAVPGDVAAAVAACVAEVPPEPCRLRGVAVRLFHNRQDGRIPLRVARRAEASLRACGVDAVLTVLPEEGHDAWTAAFSRRELYEWLATRRASGRDALPPRQP